MEQRIRQFLGDGFEIVECPRLPDGVYLVHPAQERFFMVHAKNEARIGSTRIVAVNKATGTVRDAGYTGE
jgi:hypothetical protein